MKWKITGRTFIAPETFDAGAIIEYHGPIAMTMEPVDEEAQAAWDKWAKAHPEKAAYKRPFDELELAPTAALIEEAPAPKEVSTAPQLGAPQKAKPGLADGGKALPIPKG